MEHSNDFALKMAALKVAAKELEATTYARGINTNDFLMAELSRFCGLVAEVCDAVAEDVEPKSKNEVE